MSLPSHVPTRVCSCTCMLCTIIPGDHSSGQDRIWPVLSSRCEIKLHVGSGAYLHGVWWGRFAGSLNCSCKILHMCTLSRVAACLHGILDVPIYVCKSAGWLGCHLTRHAAKHATCAVDLRCMQQLRTDSILISGISIVFVHVCFTYCARSREI